MFLQLRLSHQDKHLLVQLTTMTLWHRSLLLSVQFPRSIVECVLCMFVESIYFCENILNIFQVEFCIVHTLQKIHWISGLNIKIQLGSTSIVLYFCIFTQCLLWNKHDHCSLKSLQTHHICKLINCKLTFLRMRLGENTMFGEYCSGIVPDMASLFWAGQSNVRITWRCLLRTMLQPLARIPAA